MFRTGRQQGGRLGRIVVAWLVAAVVVGIPLGAIGSASASGLGVPYGFKTPTGSFAMPYYEAFLQEPPITPGSLVFGDAVDIEFYNAIGNRTIAVSVYENGTSLGRPSLWANYSYAVAAGSFQVLPTLQLPSTSVTLPTRLCVDGGCENFLHQTPFTLIPYGTLTFGGLDLIVFGVTLELVLLMAPLTIYAKRLARRALYFPKLNWALLMPHILAGGMLLVANDYPALDSAFGGLTWVALPLVVASAWFFFILHSYNVAAPAQADRIAPEGDDRPGLTSWWVMIGVFPDGRWGVIGTRFRDAIYRLYGKFPVLWDPRDHEEDALPPWVVPVSNRKIGEPDAIWNAQKHRWDSFRLDARGGSPFESFPQHNVRIRGVDAAPKRELPIYRLHVDHDKWLAVKLPYLSWHREEKLEAEYNKDGTVAKRARIRRRLTWPHIVVPKVDADLSDWHWEEPLAASLGYIDQERVYRLVHRLRRMVYRLMTAVYPLADEQTRQTMHEVFERLDRERFAPDEAELKEGVVTAKNPETSEPAEENDSHATLGKGVTG